MTSLAAVPPPSAPIPPQNLEAEESVLGAMMISPGAIAAVSEVLDGHEFYRESHSMIFRAALVLYGNGEPVDVISLTDRLDETGELEKIGGRVRLHELAALVPASANAKHYAKIVKEMATLRGLITAGGEVSRLGWDRPGETEELVDRAQQIVYELDGARAREAFIPVEGPMKDVFELTVKMYESDETMIGAPTGFIDLDKITSGLQKGNLIIVAARPSMGKTSLGLGIASHLGLRLNVPVGIFSLEMSRIEIVQRLWSLESKIELSKLREGRLSKEDWTGATAAADRIARAPIQIDMSGSPTSLEMRSKARLLKSRFPDLGLIVVDYIQLASSGQRAENRTQEVSQISRALKMLARDLEVPVLALSQLSRAVENRTDKRPILSDLRESGGLEQDADLVWFLYRDEYYNHQSEEKGIAEVHVAKHRNGPTDTVKLAFLKRTARFDNLHKSSK